MGKLFRVSLLVFAGMFFLVSCEKDEALVKEDLLVQEEGLKSTSGGLELSIDAVSQTSNAEVVLHKHYDASLTSEEIEAKWNVDKAKFEKLSNLKAYSTEWFIEVTTYTGTQTNNETDGRVEFNTVFTADIGVYSTGYIVLNNPGDDREGGWDYYLVRDYISGEAVQWLELNYSYLRLQGTDGWFVTAYGVHLNPTPQTLPATGSSSIYS